MSVAKVYDDETEEIMMYVRVHMTCKGNQQRKTEVK